MLKCRNVAQRADTYLDKDLSLREHLAVSLHLLMCGKCRTFVKQMRLALQVFRALPPDESSDEDINMIIENVRKR